MHARNLLQWRKPSKANETSSATAASHGPNGNPTSLTAASSKALEARPIEQVAIVIKELQLAAVDYA